MAKRKFEVTVEGTMKFIVETDYSFQSDADVELFTSSFGEFLLTTDYLVKEV